MHNIVTIMSALAEPTRFEVMKILSDGGEHCVCELMKKLDATQSRMSRHMASLKMAGLVIDRRDAQWVRYRLNPALSLPVLNLIEAALVVADATENERAAA